MNKEYRFSPMRGDLVSYGGEVLYFQSNGSSCYLYKRREDVGRPSLAVYSPSSRCVTKPTEYEMATKVRAVPAKEATRDAFDMIYERLLEERRKDSLRSQEEDSQSREEDSQ